MLMALITQTSINVKGAVDLSVTTLTGADSFIFQPDGNQFLVIENGTGSAKTPKVTGSTAPANFFIRGYGYADLSGGLTFSAVSTGASVAIPLHSIREWLKGSVTLTGCAGCKAYIVTHTSVPNSEPLFIQAGRLIASGKLTVNSRLWG
jgi:hypothetical protein